jgi:hypothetical protein
VQLTVRCKWQHLMLSGLGNLTRVLTAQNPQSGQHNTQRATVRAHPGQPAAARLSGRPSPRPSQPSPGRGPICPPQTFTRRLALASTSNVRDQDATTSRWNRSPFQQSTLYSLAGKQHNVACSCWIPVACQDSCLIELATPIPPCDQQRCH